MIRLWGMFMRLGVCSIISFIRYVPLPSPPPLTTSHHLSPLTSSSSPLHLSLTPHPPGPHRPRIPPSPLPLHDPPHTHSPAHRIPSPSNIRRARGEEGEAEEDGKVGVSGEGGLGRVVGECGALLGVGLGCGLREGEGVHVRCEVRGARLEGWGRWFSFILGWFFCAILFLLWSWTFRFLVFLVFVVSFLGYGIFVSSIPSVIPYHNHPSAHHTIHTDMDTRTSALPFFYYPFPVALLFRVLSAVRLSHPN